jgi:hypothetical protein
MKLLYALLGGFAGDEKRDQIAASQYLHRAVTVIAGAFRVWSQG